MTTKASLFTTTYGSTAGTTGDGSPRGLVARVLFAMKVRRERQALLALDDTILRDIGLSRYDVEREARRGVLDLPTQNPADRRYRI
jgi:uncharacterized protein YjiS (DUF1127 family)